jgi:hypothetical protein
MITWNWSLALMLSRAGPIEEKHAIQQTRCAGQMATANDLEVAGDAARQVSRNTVQGVVDSALCSANGEGHRWWLRIQLSIGLRMIRPTRAGERARSARRAAILMSCILAFGVGACDSRHSPIPVQGWYWSTDTTPVHITFKRQNLPPGTTVPPDMTIPRADIANADPYNWPNPKVIPEHAVDVTSLRLWIALDTGEALPLAERRLTLRDPYGLDRTKYAIFAVHYGGVRDDLPVPQRPPPPREGAWTEGMEIDKDGYVRVRSDHGLWMIRPCRDGGGEPPRPDLHCNYHAQLTRKIGVTAHFSDFPAMGRLPFVERNLATIKGVICSFTDCTN